MSGENKTLGGNGSIILQKLFSLDTNGRYHLH